MFGIFSAARANKENILYTIVTIFLLERVRRGWNRIDSRGRNHNQARDAVERRQQWFMFSAAVLYALPFVVPVVKYLYRSVDELSQYVPGLAVLSSVWAFALVAIATELFLAVVIYNLLGIYVDRMNSALGFFRKIGRSVVDGSKLAVQAGGEAPRRVAIGVRDAVQDAARAGRVVLAVSATTARRAVARIPRRMPARVRVPFRTRIHSRERIDRLSA
jgi:hypothetical protein